MQVFELLVLLLWLPASVIANDPNCQTKNRITCSTEYCDTRLHGPVPRTTTSVTVQVTTTSVIIVTPTTIIPGVSGTVTATVIETVNGGITLPQSTLDLSTTITTTTALTTTATVALTETLNFNTTTTTYYLTTVYPSCVNTIARPLANPTAARTASEPKVTDAKPVHDDAIHRFPTKVYCTKSVTRLTTVYSTGTAAPLTIYGSSVVHTTTTTATTNGPGVVVTPTPLTRTSLFFVTETSTIGSITSTTTTISTTSTFVSTTTSTVVVGTTGTPVIFLPSPTAIIGDVQSGSPLNYDDYAYTIDLPFPVTFYGVSNSTIMVSINGHFSLDGEIVDGGFSAYTESPFPYSNYAFPNNTIAPLWDDLYLFQGTQQGVYYEIDGIAPRRNLTIEWYTSHYLDPSQYYHFAAVYQEALPNHVQFIYLDVSDFGISAAVGAQSVTTNQYTQYSFQQPIIYPGLVLTYDTVTNTFIPNGVIPCSN